MLRKFSLLYKKIKGRVKTASFPNQLRFGNWQNLATIVFTTFKANAVRPLHFATLRAFHQVKCFNGVVCPPPTATCFRNSSLWYSTHVNILSN
jgi:hypothetical protein